jgi:uncharacterized repeat protein (TIGR01451 family)
MNPTNRKLPILLSDLPRLAIKIALMIALMIVLLLASPAVGNNSALAQGGGDVSISMFSSPNPVPIGSQVTYTITVRNSSTSSTGGITVLDNLPPTTTFISCSTTGKNTCGGSGNNRFVTIGFLASGDSETITITALVNCMVDAALINTASVRAPGDINPSNDVATVATSISNRPVIECPDDIVTTNTPGRASAFVEFRLPPVSSACSGMIFSFVPPSGSTFPIGTTSVTFTASIDRQILQSCSFNVTVIDNELPAITCPGNMVVTVPPGQSSVIVRYPSIRVSDNAPGVTTTTTPPSGSLFSIGTTMVTILAIDASGNRTACSFAVTVVDRQPPSIVCPNDITMVTPTGQSSAIVNYSPPQISDNSSGVTVVSNPPSGSTFPIGNTTVNVTATDSSGNQATCSFIVTVLDREPPSISCPEDIIVDATPGRCQAVISYPAPQVSDNAPGVTVDFSPPSGSSFSVGSTRVTITATDQSGNRSSCTFNVRVSGSPKVRWIFEGDATSLEFGPVAARRRQRSRPPFRFFTMENIGCAPLSMAFLIVSRTGSDVASGRITDPNDMGLFLLRSVNQDGTETPMENGAVRVLAEGASMDFRVLFNPLIPFVADRVQSLSASEVLPNLINSELTFLTSESAAEPNGNEPTRISLVGRLNTEAILINPRNPELAPVINFARNGDRFSTEFAVYDSNLDVSRATFQFLDAADRQVGNLINVDLSEPIRQRGILTGMSFGILQEFSGANDNPEIVRVRVTIFDGVSSDTKTSGQVNATTATAFQMTQSFTGARVVLPMLDLIPSRP